MNTEIQDRYADVYLVIHIHLVAHTMQTYVLECTNRHA